MGAHHTTFAVIPYNSEIHFISCWAALFSVGMFQVNAALVIWCSLQVSIQSFFLFVNVHRKFLSKAVHVQWDSVFAAVCQNMYRGSWNFMGSDINYQISGTVTSLRQDTVCCDGTDYIPPH